MSSGRSSLASSFGCVSGFSDGSRSSITSRFGCVSGFSHGFGSSVSSSRSSVFSSSHGSASACFSSAGSHLGSRSGRRCSRLSSVIGTTTSDQRGCSSNDCGECESFFHCRSFNRNNDRDQTISGNCSLSAKAMTGNCCYLRQALQQCQWALTAKNELFSNGNCKQNEEESVYPFLWLRILGAIPSFLTKTDDAIATVCSSPSSVLEKHGLADCTQFFNARFSVEKQPSNHAFCRQHAVRTNTPRLQLCLCQSCVSKQTAPFFARPAAAFVAVTQQTSKSADCYYSQANLCQRLESSHALPFHQSSDDATHRLSRFHGPVN